ncbi:MAG TPA: chromate transporter [Fimbriimonas sp.]|nr:chromate transporter [Fimbriimonas sp.]
MVLRSALLSSGGMGNVPLLHDDLVSRGLATDRQFAESLAVGQLSPGPNGLWVVCLGYFLGGWLGALASLFAIMLPPLLVLLVDKLYDRHQDHPAVEGFMTGLEVAVIGVFIVVMFGFLQSAPHNALTAAVSVAGLGLTVWGRAPIVVILVAAALAGIAVR